VGAAVGQGVSEPSAIVVDSHCHLQTLDVHDCDRILDEAREAGVKGFLAPAIRLEDSDRLLDLCRRHEDVFCALGVHPHEAKNWTSRHAAQLRDLIDEAGVVAVGECGLDFHYDRAPRIVQLEVMRRQWEIAIDAGLPVVVHNRKSDEEMLSALADPAAGELRGVFHSFAGSMDLARDLVERGLYIGVSGMVTFPRAENVRGVVRVVPPDRLLVETDTPYLAPVPYRGKPNRPAYVIEIVKALAAELGMDGGEAAAMTSANFLSLFKKVTGERGSRSR
jgi:TatD DNase family protein